MIKTGEIIVISVIKAVMIRIVSSLIAISNRKGAID